MLTLSNGYTMDHNRCLYKNGQLVCHNRSITECLLAWMDCLINEQILDGSIKDAVEMIGMMKGEISELKRVGRELARHKENWR